MRERKTMFANILHAAAAIAGLATAGVGGALHKAMKPGALHQAMKPGELKHLGKTEAPRIPRGKGRVDSPRQRPNRVTISRRVRRKHRKTGR